MLMRGFTSVRDTGGADYGMKVHRKRLVRARAFHSGMLISRLAGNGDLQADPDRFRVRPAARLAHTARAADGVPKCFARCATPRARALTRSRSGSRRRRPARIRLRACNSGWTIEAAVEGDALGHLCLRACLCRGGDPARSVPVRTIEHGN
jgi:hypothetical protein